MERVISSLYKRTNLLAGLVLIVFVAAGPAYAVLVNLQRELRQERETQARSIALQRAQVVSASLDKVIEGTRQMMVAISVTQRARELRPACAGLLNDLRGGTAAYSILSIVRRDGTVVCSSAAAELPPDAQAALSAPFLSVDRFTTGRYVRIGSLPAPVLAFALPFAASPPGDGALVLAGLDLRNLDTLLATLGSPTNGHLVVADQDGTILARAPDTAGVVGSKIDASSIPMAASAPGAMLVENADGSLGVTGYVPAGKDPAHLSLIAGFDVADLVSGIDAAANRGYLLISLGAALSILLALFLGHRYLRAPASVLLEAARRWGTGDLRARANMPPGATQEFTGLGVAFNEMAEMLQHQRAELQALNDALELRVADRTRALLESNNRLQVEIAERELSEASLRQAQKLQAVGQLAGGMAHDFNNLLTAILGSLELLRKRLTGQDGRQTRLIDTATEAVERGSRLTAQLLAFSRKQPLLAVSVNLAEAIAGMAGLLTRTLGSSIRLETRVEDGLWPAMLDPNQFEATVLNLALNARDAMPGGGCLVVAATNASVTPASPWSDLAPGDYIRVVVSDTGSGMRADVVNRAFEPFFTTKAPGKGSGLGLSQVHGMVRQSGGSVLLESQPGMGAKITMLLPRSLTAPQAHEPGWDQTQPAFGRDEAVLLVDDDDQVRDVTQAILVDAGYTVLTAPDGTSAIDHLESGRHRISLVIADYAMPGMTGRELLQTVKRRWPGMAVMLATGYADYPELAAQDLPVDHIVRKPFRSNELLARIYMVVNRQNEAAALENNVPAV